MDREVQAARSRRTAWTIAGVAVAAALFEAVALAMLAPLKTVEPIALLVDRQTGHVQTIDPLRPQRIAADDALTQSLLAQYVIAREGFDRATVTLDYRKVALWSAGAARSRYLAAMPATNPASPLARYPAGTIVTARVKSVSRLAQNVALVRFDTQQLDREGRGGDPSPWVAVIRYRFVDAPMALSDRLLNPLGFQVTGYRRDGEAVTPQETVVAPAPAASIVPGVAPTRADRPVARRQPIGTSGPGMDRMAPSRPRAVPVNQLPMGSPLSPGVAASDVVAAQP